MAIFTILVKPVSDPHTLEYSIAFSLTWTLFYVVIGTWVKGLFSVPKNVENRYKPIFMSHLLFCTFFMNPWILYCVFSSRYYFHWTTKGTVDLILCLLIMPVSLVIDFVSIKLLSKSKHFTWTTYKPLMDRYFWVQSTLVMFGALLGHAMAQFIF